MFVAHVLCFLLSPVRYSATADQSPCVRVGVVSSLGSPNGDQPARHIYVSQINIESFCVIRTLRFM